MHSQLALLFRCVGGEARTCIALNVREYFSIGLMRFGQASGIYRDPLQQNDKPIFEWGHYYAYKMNRESYFDRRSHRSSLLQALSISRAYAFPSNLRSVLCKTNCGVLALFQYLCPAQYVVAETVFFLYPVCCTAPQLNRQQVRSFFTSHLPPCMLAGQRST